MSAAPGNLVRLRCWEDLPLTLNAFRSGREDEKRRGLSKGSTRPNRQNGKKGPKSEAVASI